MELPVFTLPPQLQYGSRKNEVKTATSGLDFALFDDVDSWTVKIHFKIDGAPWSGNGAFVNIPDSPNRVILTAAHNIVSDSGEYFHDFVVEENGKHYSIERVNIKVCQRYLTEPKGEREKNASVDYAVILIPRESGPKTPKGFGFDLRLAYADSFPGQVHVTGHRVAGGSLGPSTSANYCKDFGEEHLEYLCKTEKGISGAPVWIAYNGYPTIVAVHNHRADDKIKNAGSLGARVSVVMLKDVLSWAGVALFRRSLCAEYSKEEHTPGLYVAFSEVPPFARVRKGSGSAFDIFVAQVNANQPGTLYAFQLLSDPQSATTSGVKWLEFEAAVPGRTPTVKLTSTEVLSDGCLFTLKPQKSTPKKPSSAKRILVTSSSGKNMQLKITGRRMRQSALGGYIEGHDVSFVHQPLEDATKYTTFDIEPM